MMPPSATPPAEDTPLTGGLHRPPPRPGFVLRFFHALSMLTMIAALMMATFQILSVVLFFTAADGRQPAVTFTGVILRIYGVVLCAATLLTEAGWTWAREQVRFLQHWVPRGLFYIFLGLLVIEEASECTEAGGGGGWVAIVASGWANEFMALTGCVMSVFGAVYVVMGSCPCIRDYHTEQERQYRLAKDISNL
eukprot:Sspe_Gene.94670::Locus_67015_Transcript_2_2_Confidence_0.500_Length_705::g.94670::m.94670